MVLLVVCSVVKADIVPVFEIDATFEHIAKGLERSCERSGGDLTASYLFEQCRSSAALLVVAHDDTGIIGAVVLRFENWSGKSVLRTLGLWCNGKGAYASLAAKKNEIGKLYGAKSMVAEARVSPRGMSGYLRRHPDAKILRCLMEVEIK